MPNSTESLDAKRMAALQAVFKKSDEEGVSADDLDAVEKLAQELIAHGVSAEAVTASGPLNAEIVKALGPRMPGALFHAIQEIQGAGKEVVGAFSRAVAKEHGNDRWIWDEHRQAYFLGGGVERVELTQGNLDEMLEKLMTVVRDNEFKSETAVAGAVRDIDVVLRKTMSTPGNPIYEYVSRKIPEQVLVIIKRQAESDLIKGY